MRFVLAAAMAVSVAGAAWAIAPSKTVAEVAKTAITENVDAKVWNSSQCWICLPWFQNK